MKKLFSTLLTLLFVLSMGTIAMASGNTTTPETYEDMETVTIKKHYKVKNPLSVSPEETFKFEILPFSVRDAGAGIVATNMPMPTIGEVDYSEGEAGSATAIKDITVTLPVYTSVGVYSYTIRELPGNSAGVTYYNKDIRLVVTVIEQNGKVRVAAVHTEAKDEKKNDNFPNEYFAGGLAVRKVVTGNLGDKEKNFTVEVMFTAPEGKIVKAPIKYVDDGVEKAILMANWSAGKATATITLKHDETITFTNIPYGVTYEIEEDDYSGDGYAAPVYSRETGVISVAAEGVEITNNKNADVDTGISLDSIPYIMILGLAVLGISGLFLRRRKNAKF